MLVTWYFLFGQSRCIGFKCMFNICFAYGDKRQLYKQHILIPPLCVVIRYERLIKWALWGAVLVWPSNFDVWTETDPNNNSTNAKFVGIVLSFEAFSLTKCRAWSMEFLSNRDRGLYQILSLIVNQINCFITKPELYRERERLTQTLCWSLSSIVGLLSLCEFRYETMNLIIQTRYAYSSI